VRRISVWTASDTRKVINKLKKRTFSRCKALSLKKWRSIFNALKTVDDAGGMCGFCYLAHNACRDCPAHKVCDARRSTFGKWSDKWADILFLTDQLVKELEAVNPPERDR